MAAIEKEMGKDAVRFVKYFQRTTEIGFAVRTKGMADHLRTVGFVVAGRRIKPTLYTRPGKGTLHLVHPVGALKGGWRDLTRRRFICARNHGTDEHFCQTVAKFVHVV